MFTFTASSGSVLPQNCAKFNMQHKNQPYKAMTMMLLLLLLAFLTGTRFNYISTAKGH